jgi:hypothetical protein
VENELQTGLSALNLNPGAPLAIVKNSQPRKISLSYLLIGLASIFATALYLNRASRYWLLSQGRGAGFILLILLPILLFGLIALVAHFIATIWHGFQAKGSWIPALLTIFLYIGTYYLPIPVTPEEKFFHQYNDDFSQVVALAASVGLPDGDGEGCGATTAFKLPAEYQHLSPRCVYMTDAKMIEFNPLQNTFLVVYAETPADLARSLTCSIRGTIWVQVSDDWYVCVDADD